MLRILIPVDGSEHSLRTVKHVVWLKENLAQKLEARLLNVQPPVPVKDLLFDGRLSELRRLEEPIKKRGLELLSPARSALDAAAIENLPHVELGEPAPVIAGFARTYHCEMIVMGTHGLGAVASLCLGSVAAKVPHLASVPVLLVP